MRFLPVFLDLKAGPVALIGAGELLRAKLRVLAAAGARLRVYAIDGNDDVNLSSEDAARIDFAVGDPLTADLAGIIAVVCAGAGDVGVAMSVRAKALGLPVNVMDDLEHSSFIFPAIVDRGAMLRLIRAASDIYSTATLEFASLKLKLPCVARLAALLLDSS